MLNLPWEGERYVIDRRHQFHRATAGDMIPQPAYVGPDDRYYTRETLIEALQTEDRPLRVFKLEWADERRAVAHIITDEAFGWAWDACPDASWPADGEVKRAPQWLSEYAASKGWAPSLEFA